MSLFARYCFLVLTALLSCLNMSADAAGKEHCIPADDQQQQACVVPVSHDEQPATAVLRDGFQGCRLANGRPERIIPSNVTGGGWSSGEVPSALKPLNLNHSQRHVPQGLVVLSYRACVSCEQYFIALRHIIR